MSNPYDNYSEGEQEYMRDFYSVTLRACINYGGDIAACWDEMVDFLGRDLAWEIYDELRVLALSGWASEKVMTWAASISGERQ